MRPTRSTASPEHRNASTDPSMTGADPLLLPSVASTAERGAQDGRDAGAVREAFLQGMSQAAATVNIVTTDGSAGRAGVTVSAMSSVSADAGAPTLLICVHELNPATHLICRNGCFVVNVLRDDQSVLSDVFAGRLRQSSGSDRFGSAEWVSMTNGSPRLRDPLVAFACDVAGSETVGTHRLFVGAVREVFLDEGRPLIYTNRDYAAPVGIAARQGPDNGNNVLRIGALQGIVSPFLDPALQALRETGELSEVPSVSLCEGTPQQLVDLLLSEAIDVAFLIEEPARRRIRATAICRFRPSVVLARDHPVLQARTPGGPTAETLRPHEMILHDGSPNREFALSWIGQAGEPRIAVRTGSFGTALDLVARGSGYGVFATWMDIGDAHDPDGLISYPVRADFRRPVLTLCECRDRVRTPAAALFLAACEGICRSEGT